MMMIQRIEILAAALVMVVTSIGSTTASGQRFEIIEPSGVVTGTINVAPGRIIVYEGTGERILYSRDALYDSSDGRFVGYYNLTLNRVLRFPRSGSGPLQSADLDDRVPRFRETTRIVRPVGNFTPIRPGGVLGRPGSGFGRPWLGGLDWSITGGYGPTQYPSGPYAAAYPPRARPTQSVLIDSQTIPNPQLPPARVVLRNDGPREVQVGIVDLQNPGKDRSVRIRPSSSVAFELERDAGARQISHYRVITPYGESVTREIVTDIPPTIRYEVVVHEWAVQSVAIDRTGKSPNVIEDINYQGKGLGRFQLPPGPELQSGTIDVYRAARAQGNQGTVAPIVPREPQPSDTASPLERAILEAQRAAQRN